MPLPGLGSETLQVLPVLVKMRGDQRGSRRDPPKSESPYSVSGSADPINYHAWLFYALLALRLSGHRRRLELPRQRGYTLFLTRHTSLLTGVAWDLPSLYCLTVRVEEWEQVSPLCKNFAHS